VNDLHVDASAREDVEIVQHGWQLVLHLENCPKGNKHGRVRRSKGGVTPIDSIVTAATARSKLWPALFDVLSVDHTVTRNRWTRTL